MLTVSLNADSLTVAAEFAEQLACMADALNYAASESPNDAKSYGTAFTLLATLIDRHAKSLKELLDTASDEQE